MRYEWTHAPFLGQSEGLLVVGLGLRSGPAPDCSDTCPPRSLCLVLRLTVRDGERTRLRLLQWGGTKPRRLILRLRYPLARPACGEGRSSCLMPVPPACPAAAR